MAKTDTFQSTHVVFLGLKYTDLYLSVIIWKVINVWNKQYKYSLKCLNSFILHIYGDKPVPLIPHAHLTWRLHSFFSFLSCF